jgi:hypothetical protein
MTDTILSSKFQELVDDEVIGVNDVMDPKIRTFLFVGIE